MCICIHIHVSSSILIERAFWILIRCEWASLSLYITHIYARKNKIMRTSARANVSATGKADEKMQKWKRKKDVSNCHRLSSKINERMVNWPGV